MFTTMLNGDYDAAMLVIDYPPVGSPYKDKSAHQAMDRALAAAGKAAGKPVFHASVNTESIPPEDAEALIVQGIVPLNGLHDAAQVVAKWANYCKMVGREKRQGDAALGPKVPFAVAALPSNGVTVNEAESKRRLSSYGLNVPKGNILTIEMIRELPEIFDAPMVLKVLHDQLAHKTEVGGVALNIRGQTDAIAAAERMITSVKEHDASIELTTFLMEPMQPAPLAELIVGVKRDPLFGLVLVIGAGGILVELLKDATPLLLPVNRSEVENALRGLKSFALLDGFRGKPKVNLEPVIDAIMAIAAYAGDHRHNLLELDVNPLMLGTDSAIAVDALIIEHR